MNALVPRNSFPSAAPHWLTSNVSHVLATARLQGHDVTWPYMVLSIVRKPSATHNVQTVHVSIRTEPCTRVFQPQKKERAGQARKGKRANNAFFFFVVSSRSPEDSPCDASCMLTEGMLRRGTAGMFPM